ncbi:MAG: HEAT repeat domain-containing protein [Myxococcota bacterium]
MNPTVHKILELLHDTRMERRCAAAMVLGALDAREAAVIKALGEALHDDNRVLRLYVLEALEELRAAGMTEQLLPLLDSPDEEVRRRVQVVLERQGAKAASVLARDLASAPLARRRALVAILARNRTPESLDKLLLMLRDPDVAEHTLAALRAEMDSASARDKTLVARKTVRLLRGRAAKNDPFATANGLRLLGYVGDAKLLPVLAGFLADKLPAAVRAAAVAALRRPLSGSRKPGAVVVRLLQLADDPEPSVARAALDTLRNVEMPVGLAGALLKLVDGRHPEARTFAADRLGTMDTQAAAKRLFETLRKGEPAARDAAARSLGRLTSAVRPLLAAVAREDDAAMLATYARVLRSHGERIPAAARKAIAKRAAKLLERKPDDPRATSLLDLLGAIDAKLRDRTLIDLALRLKKLGRLADAQAFLRPLGRSEHLDDEARFALAVLALTLGPRDLAHAHASRGGDPTVAAFGKLLAAGFPVPKRLKRERSIDGEHLYYLGFCLVESDSEDLKDLGGDLLSHLAKKSPGSKVGRAAKNKLGLSGAAA